MVILRVNRIRKDSSDGGQAFLPMYTRKRLNRRLSAEGTYFAQTKPLFLLKEQGELLSARYLKIRRLN
jgi:hypothetical protein